MRFVRLAVLLILLVIAAYLYILCRKQGINLFIPANILASQLAALKQTDQERKLDKKIAENIDAFSKKIVEMDKWAEEYVVTAEKECADFKKKLYASGLDKEQQDLIWGAVLASSVYCWKVDAPKSQSPQKPAKKSALSKKTK